MNSRFNKLFRFVRLTNAIAATSELNEMPKQDSNVLRYLSDAYTADDRHTGYRIGRNIFCDTFNTF